MKVIILNFKFNFFSKVATAFIITVSITILIMNYAFDPHIEKMLEESLYEESQVIIESMDVSLSHLLSHNEFEELQHMLERLGEYERIDEIIVINSNYDVLFSNNLNKVGQHLDSPFLKDVVDRRVLQNIKNDMDNQRYLIATPIHIDENASHSNDEYFVCLTMDANIISKNYNTLTHNIHMITIVVAVVFLIIIIGMLYRFIQKPLLKFMTAAERISKNEYDTRVAIESKDEWSLLSQSFNKMAENIESNSRTLMVEKNKAENENSLKSEFLANMSHEIRTPLNTILGFSELLYENEENTEKKENLKIVNNSGKYLLSLINDVLDFSRINSDKIRLEESPFIVEDMIKDINNMFIMKIEEKKLNFISNISPMVPEVLIGDPYRLKQIIINLVSNSIKFTNQGKVSLYLNYIEEKLVIMVADTGIGIPEENRQKIFNMFEQSSIDTTRLYGGSGLGLAIVKKLVELMDGHIILYSEVNNGTKITIRLPLEAGSIDDIDAEIKHEKFVNHWLNKNPEIRTQIYDGLIKISSYSKELSFYISNKDINNTISYTDKILRISKNYSMDEIISISDKIASLLKNDEIQWDTISFLNDNLGYIVNEISEKNKDLENTYASTEPKVLIAEDVLENRLLMDKFIKNTGAKVNFVVNGKEAIEALTYEKFDLLLLDIQMPVMNGIEVLRYIKEHNIKGETKIFVLTADTQKENIQNYFSLGADGYLSKPVSKKKIIEIIKGRD